MATKGTRWLIVDDTHPSIRYTGPWYESDVFDNDVDGVPYGGSQHGTNGTASLSFSFTGNQLLIVGTSAVRNSSRGVMDPDWHCFIDGEELDRHAADVAPVNNWVICDTNSMSLLEGEHTLTINTTSTRNTPFWIDHIEYQPLANMTSILKNSTVFIEQTDPAVQYVSGSWQPLSPDTILTLQAGAVVTAKFTGTKLSWYGETPVNFPQGSSQATYTIDGGPAVTFQVPGLPFDSVDMLHQVLFETSDLPLMEHTLSVTHNGPGAPLTLDYLLVQNGEIPLPNGATPNLPPGSNTTGDPSRGNPSPSETPASPGSHPPVGPIVGGALGGVAILCICALALLFLRRKKKRQYFSADGELKSPSSSEPLQMSGRPVPPNTITPYGHVTALTTHQPPSSGTDSCQNSAGWPGPQSALSPTTPGGPLTPFSLGYGPQSAISPLSGHGAFAFPPISLVATAGYPNPPSKRDEKIRTANGFPVEDASGGPLSEAINSSATLDSAGVVDAQEGNPDVPPPSYSITQT